MRSRLNSFILWSSIVFSPWSVATWAQVKDAEPKISTVPLLQKIEYSDLDLGKALPPKVVILLDSSGSMGQPLDKKKSKMFYAKKLFRSYLVDQWREKADVGLLVYGGRRKQDCGDYFMAIKVGERSLPKIERAVKALQPTGMTPIARSLEMAIDQIKNYPGPKRIMIFTDGEETCGGDSCKLLESAIQEKIFDLEMFVTGIGMKENSKDLDGLRCLGKTFGAPDEKSLQNVLNQMNENIQNASKRSQQTFDNLFVESPDPDVSVIVYQTVNGQKKQISTFKARESARLDPGEYHIEVMLKPTFVFEKVVIPPKKRVTLKIKGAGFVTVKFVDGLLDVEVLNRHSRVVEAFLSDEKHLLAAGKYDLRITGEPFFEKMIRDVVVAPGSDEVFPITGLGILQVDHEKMIGAHIIAASGKQVGSYVTNYPFVLPVGNYSFILNKVCKIEEITVREQPFLQRIACPKLRR
jgi:Ca-activated chloride channel family protein